MLKIHVFGILVIRRRRGLEVGVTAGAEIMIERGVPNHMKRRSVPDLVLAQRIVSKRRGVAVAHGEFIFS